MDKNMVAKLYVNLEDEVNAKDQKKGTACIKKVGEKQGAEKKKGSGEAWKKWK